MNNIKTWKERVGLANTDPFRALIGVEWEMQAEIDELRDRFALLEETLAALIPKKNPITWTLS